MDSLKSITIWVLWLAILTGTGCGSDDLKVIPTVPQNQAGLNGGAGGTGQLGLVSGTFRPRDPLRISWQIRSNVLADYRIEACGGRLKSGCLHLAVVRCSNQYYCDVDQSEAYFRSELDPHLYETAEVDNYSDRYSYQQKTISVEEERIYWGHRAADLTGSQIRILATQRSTGITQELLISSLY